MSFYKEEDYIYDGPVYISKADLWCQKCGEKICEELNALGLKPKDVEDERTYDSDDYPKISWDNGESDFVRFCASGGDCLDPLILNDESHGIEHKYGCYLGGDLTKEGLVTLLDQILDAALEGELSEILKFELSLYREDFRIK